MARDYKAAVEALNSLQSNFTVVDAIRKSGRSMNQNAIPEMIEWCRRVGYEPADFDRLGAIHVAGTKGKGSTASFVSSILCQYSQSQGKPSKVGLYTSPHLRFVRERIQINNQPLSEDAFAKYFFEIWDRLETAAKTAGHSDPSSPSTKPVYFRYLTLMAFHCYLCEGVDAAVIECGIGGEYDSTNVLIKPSVTGVTSLGIDHTAMLGDTIESIAWHKAGIFKPNVPAFTVPQQDSALEVLRQRANERNTDLTLVPISPAIKDVNLGIAADFQKSNASLAMAIASEYLTQRGVKTTVATDSIDSTTSLPLEFRQGLEASPLKGRFDTRKDRLSKLTWCLDGGHTLESIEVAGRWFASLVSSISNHAAPSPPSHAHQPTMEDPCILIFNQQTRDADALARRLHATLASALDDNHPFAQVIFCTNTTYKDTGFRPDLTSINTNADEIVNLSVQNALASTWRKVDPSADVKVVRTIEEAIMLARETARQSVADSGTEAKVLVTGSLHLIGGAIEVLESEREKAEVE